jgi:hypothetical protein
MGMMETICKGVQEALWCGEMNSEILDHLGTCADCKSEFQMIREVGLSVEAVSIPLQSRTLLPPRELIEEVVREAQRQNRFKWISGGVVAACILLGVTQAPKVIDLNLVSGQQEHGVAPTAQQEQFVSEQIQSLLERHGWKAAGAERTEEKIYPANDTDEPGNTPLTLYWAYHSELSKDAGLDLTRAKGKKVRMHVVPLVADRPDLQAEAVFVESDGQVVGGWLNAPTSAGSMSLTKRTFADLGKGTWGEWLKATGLVDYSKEPEKGYAKLSPVEVIHKYYDASSRRDLKTAYAQISKRRQYDLMTMGQGALYADGWKTDGMQPANLQKAKVKEIRDASHFLSPAFGGGQQAGPGDPETLGFNRQPFAENLFSVTVDEEYKTPLEQPNGSHHWFVKLVKETEDAPWKIDGFSTGP